MKSLVPGYQLNAGTAPIYHEPGLKNLHNFDNIMQNNNYEQNNLEISKDNHLSFLFSFIY